MRGTDRRHGHQNPHCEPQTEPPDLLTPDTHNAHSIHKSGSRILAGDVLLPGHRLITPDHTDEPDLVIADVSRVDPDEVAEAYPDVPLLGYTNHTDTAGLRAAHLAGFEQVVAKSALVERAAHLVRDLAPSLE